MKTVRYDKSKILGVTVAGITYIDDEGERGFIDFVSCRSNWIEYVKKSEEFKVSNLTGDQTKCVAWRDFFSIPPYFEFFSEPRIRFEFFAHQTLVEKLLGRPARGWAKDFIELQFKINQVGWSSFDLG